ncbi:hypothetical protein ES702_02466 [subsurface metagenome]
MVFGELKESAEPLLQPPRHKYLRHTFLLEPPVSTATATVNEVLLVSHSLNDNKDGGPLTYVQLFRNSASH